MAHVSIARTPDPGLKIQELLRVAQEAMSLHDFTSAERHGNQALTLAYERLGHDHAETILPLATLARIYVNSWNFSRAEICALTAIELLTSSNQTDSLSAIRMRIILALAMTMQNNRQGVDGVFKKAIAGMRQHLGSRSIELVRTIYDQATAYSHMSRYQEAEELFQSILSVVRDLPTIPGAELDKVLLGIAVAAYGQGDNNRAMVHAEAAYESALLMAGTDHPRIGSIHALMWNLGMALQDSESAENHARGLLVYVARHGAVGVDAETVAAAQAFVSWVNERQCL